MTHSHNKITENDLHALVDGQLTSERLSEVKKYLEDQPQDVQKVIDWELQKKGLKVLFDPILAEPLPESLVNIINQQSTPSHWLSRVAAVMAWISLGLILGWVLHDYQVKTEFDSNTPRYVTLAAHAHEVYLPEVRHPVEVNASEEQHLVKWLSKRLKGPVKIPHFTETGFLLVGGRLLPGEGHAAAQFMYENNSGDRLTLYVSKPENDYKETAFHYKEHNGTGLFYWIDADFSYALVGNIARESLLKLAHRVYQELTEIDAG